MLGQQKGKGTKEKAVCHNKEKETHRKILGQESKNMKSKAGRKRAGVADLIM